MKEVMQELGPDRVRYAGVDVTQPDDVTAALDLAQESLGTVNCVVSCAGIAVAQRTYSRKGAHSLDDFSRVMHVNTTGTFNVLRLAAERMAATEPDGNQPRAGLNVSAARTGPPTLPLRPPDPNPSRRAAGHHH